MQTPLIKSVSTHKKLPTNKGVRFLPFILNRGQVIQNDSEIHRNRFLGIS